MPRSWASASSVLELTSRTVQGIETALHRLDAGEFGTCSDCRCRISDTRLRALPFAARCLACQESATASRSRWPTRQQRVSASRWPALRLAAAVVVGLAILVLAFVELRRMRPGPPPRLSAREALLSRQNQELVKLASAAENGTLLDFKGVLIVVDQVLVQDLLHAVTPLEADVGGGFHVKIDSAEAAFGDGVAVVRMTGTASVGGASVGSRVTVLGAIDVVELDPASGVLKCGVGILGVEAAGRRGPGPRRSDRPAHRGADSRRALAAARLSRDPGQRREPPVDPGGGVEAAAHRGRGPLAHDRRAAGEGVRGRLWVFVDATLAPSPTKPEGKS